MVRGIVTKDWDHCYVCHRSESLFRRLETHHCLHGGSSGRRKLADKFGLIVPLCHSCHSMLHDSNTDIDLFVQRAGEKAFIEKYHPTDRMEGIAAFIQIFGKNYLYDTREDKFEI